MKEFSLGGLAQSSRAALELAPKARLTPAALQNHAHTHSCEPLVMLVAGVSTAEWQLLQHPV